MVVRIPTVGGNLGILKTSVKTQYRPDIPTDADFILRLTVTVTGTMRLIGWWFVLNSKSKHAGMNGREMNNNVDTFSIYLSSFCEN